MKNIKIYFEDITNTKTNKVHDSFVVENYEFSDYNKAVNKIKIFNDEKGKYFLLNELKNILLFDFNYVLNCFKK